MAPRTLPISSHEQHVALASMPQRWRIARPHGGVVRWLHGGGRRRSLRIRVCAGPGEPRGNLGDLDLQFDPLPRGIDSPSTPQLVGGGFLLFDPSSNTSASCSSKWLATRAERDRPVDHGMPMARPLSLLVLTDHAAIQLGYGFTPTVLAAFGLNRRRTTRARRGPARSVNHPGRSDSQRAADRQRPAGRVPTSHGTSPFDRWPG